MDKNEFHKKLLKYVMMLLIIYLSIMTVAGDKLCQGDVMMITMLAGTGYVFTDLYFPSIVLNKE